MSEPLDWCIYGTGAYRVKKVTPKRVVLENYYVTGNTDRIVEPSAYLVQGVSREQAETAASLLRAAKAVMDAERQSAVERYGEKRDKIIARALARSNGESGRAGR